MSRSRELRPFFFLANGEVSSQAAAREEFSNQVINARLAACLAAQPFTQNLQVPLWVRTQLRVLGRETLPLRSFLFVRRTRRPFSDSPLSA